MADGIWDEEVAEDVDASELVVDVPVVSSPAVEHAAAKIRTAADTRARRWKVKYIPTEIPAPH